MTMKKNIIVALTVASIGLAGVAQARNGDRDGRAHRDGARAEQGVKNRGNDNRRDRRDRNQATTENRRDRRANNDRATDNRRERRNRDDRIADRGHRSGKHFDKRVERRQDRQVKRIRRGLHTGDLTRGEVRRLKSQQRRVDRMRDRFGADGYYSKGERRRLAKAQKRAGKRIYNARHNDRYSYSRQRGHQGRVTSFFRDYRDY